MYGVSRIGNGHKLIVTCGTCDHFQPNRLNPLMGVGSCDPEPPLLRAICGTHVKYPMVRHVCASWVEKKQGGGDD